MLEHVCFRVDLLKDAEGFSFGKADRLIKTNNCADLYNFLHPEEVIYHNEFQAPCDTTRIRVDT